MTAQQLTIFSRSFWSTRASTCAVCQSVTAVTVQASDDMDEVNKLFDQLKQNSVLEKHIQQINIEHPLMPSLSHALISSWSRLCIQMNNSDNLALGERWAQAALDLTWEQLNIGYWKDVDLVWKETYSTAALLKALCLAMNGGHIREALEVTDKGILLGAPIIDNVLQNLASALIKSFSPNDHNIFGESRIDSLVSRNDQFTHVSLSQNAEPPMAKKKKKKVVFRSYTPIQPLCSTESSVECIGKDPLSTDTSHVPLIDLAKRVLVKFCPSLEEFMEQHMKSRVPVVISGAMDHWPAYATKKWRYASIAQRFIS